MNGRTAKALRKVFKAKENPEGYHDFKRALRGSDAAARKKAFQFARDAVASGKEVHTIEALNARD